MKDECEKLKEGIFGMTARSSFILHPSSFRHYGAQKHIGS